MIRFVNPQFLYALFTIAIPVIIHLLYFRRHKTVYFSSLRFLKIIEEQQRNRTKIKNWLILICRILAIAFLVIAFAQPYIPANQKRKNIFSNVTAIYIDNSYSMEAEGSNGILLEEAKNKAVKIIDAAQAGSRFLIVTNDFDPESRQFFYRDQAVKYCTSVKISANTPGLDMVANHIRQNAKMLNNEKQPAVTLFLVSDFQKSTSNIHLLPSDSLISYIPIMLSMQKIPNIYIDTAYFENPSHNLSQTEKLKVVITNKSGRTVKNMPVNLFINDSLKAILNANIEDGANQTLMFSYVNYQKGFYKGKVEITDFPVTFDNTWFFSYQITKLIDITEIGDKMSLPWFKALFTEDSNFTYTFQPLKQFDMMRIMASHAVIVAQPEMLSSGQISSLNEFVNNGGVLILFPSSPAGLSLTNHFYSILGLPTLEMADTANIKIRNINYSNRLFDNVFQKKSSEYELPDVSGQFTFNTLTNKNFSWILSDIFDRPVLIEKKTGKGKIYAFSFTPTQRNRQFFMHPIFVPLVYNMCLFSQPALNTSYLTGSSQTVYIPYQSAETQMIHIKAADNQLDMIPAQRTTGNGTYITIESIENAGFYYYTRNHQLLGVIAFNHNRKESDLDCYSEAETTEKLNNKGVDYDIIKQGTEAEFVANLQQLTKGIGLWKYAVMAALLFLLFEMLIIRLFR